VADESPRLGPTGRPQLLAEMCSTCILGPGDPMRLGPGRTREIIEANRRAGALLTCHTTLSYGSHPEVGQAACRGFYDAYGPELVAARFAHAVFGGFDEIPDPGGES
jgi:hypothetical protein